jgi:hypothetical protein
MIIKRRKLKENDGRVGTGYKVTSLIYNGNHFFASACTLLHSANGSKIFFSLLDLEKADGKGELGERRVYWKVMYVGKCIGI